MPLIKSLQINWLSPQEISKITSGKITSHKVVNVRTFKPELGGLFDPRIFGPFLNYECYCGKYKGKENEGQKCERCEVVITEKSVQRWRMGHINLISPVTNIVLFKTLATNLSKLLEIPAKTLEDIIYFRVYVVVDNGVTTLLKKKDILKKQIDLRLISDILQEVIQNKKLNEEVIAEAKKLHQELAEKDISESDAVFLEDYLTFLEKHLQVKIWTGTEAFRELLCQVNIDEALKKIKDDGKENLKKANSEKTRFLCALQKNSIKLEWMTIDNLLVIPCGLRPITKLKDEETIATTQINNLYRKIILINERLSYYLNLNKEMGVFFSEIIHNEKLRLQKAVDKVLYGSSLQREQTKSLLQSLSGKEGILRRYSLGKRVDYSARSVIVPNPNLALDQIGIPVKMALALYKPFIIQKIRKDKIAFTVKEAEQFFLKKDSIVFMFLNEIIKNHPVLANRAPSLHRLSIQGFYPQLTTGESIELHPLITTALNADFDGDQIAIHLPLTKKAIEEVKEYVLSPHHIVDPKNGHLIAIPTQDMILGLYYLTIESKKRGFKYYDEIDSAWKSHDNGRLGLHDLIVVPARLVGRNFSASKNQFLFTTLGKLVFSQILPPTFSFYISDLQGYSENDEENYQKILVEMDTVEEKWKNYQPLQGWKKREIINFLNKLAKITPRREMVDFLDKLKKLGFDYATYSGISISPFEVGQLVSKKKEIEAAEKKTKQAEEYYSQGFYNEEEYKQKKVDIWEECKDELQKRLISNLEKKNNTSFYHIWSSGARASSENLVQLFSMRGHTTNYLGEIIETPISSSLWEGLSPSEFFISVYGAVKGMIDLALKTAKAGDLTRRLVESSQSITIIASDCGTNSGLLLEKNGDLALADRIYGRYLAGDIYDKNKKIILTRNTLLLEKEVKIVMENKISSVYVRSPIGCEVIEGICQKCYGLDLSKQREEVFLGTAVGIIAAQSLGEPGTQLTMRTFHGGGIAGEEDITQGLPRIRQIFDNIKPKTEEKAILAKADGKIVLVEEKLIKQKTKKEEEIVYPKNKDKIVRVSQGQEVKRGEKITTGKLDLDEYLEIMGRENCQNYIRDEIREVYSNQGIDINEKHIEIFSRQMLSKVEIVNGGDSSYLMGDVVNYQKIQKINQELAAKQKKPASFRSIISSLKDLASTPDSFLAGISFQNTLKSLVNYSLYQPIDYLQGCKESLIAGQLIPVGAGFKERKKYSRETNK